MERDDLAGLEARLDGVVPMTVAFEAELARLGQTMLFTGREVGSLSTALGSGLRRAFDGVAFDGLRLSDALRQVAANYDYIFIDCPPSLELLTLNALCAANSLLVPVQGEYYALEGLSDLMNTVRIVRRSMNPSLDIEGVLLTMFQHTNLSKQVIDDVRAHLGQKVYNTVIPRNVTLSEAPSFGKPVILYDVKSPGAYAYLALAQEVVSRG